MGKTTLTWDYDVLVGDGFKIYRADSPMDPENLPLPIATVGVGVREYVDETVIDDAIYYYRIASYVGGTERLSEEIEHIAEVAGDPHWDKVVSLLHLDGDLTDEKGHTWAISGGMSFDENGHFSKGLTSSGVYNSALYMTSPAPKIGLQDFTIELFLRIASSAVNRSFVNTYGPANTAEKNIGVNNAYGKLTATNIVIDPSEDNSLATDRFNHIAYVRKMGTTYLFLDGVMVGSGTMTDNIRTDAWYFGLQPYNLSWAVAGTYDELRITIGVARYTENFTPPAEPFPNFGN